MKNFQLILTMLPKFKDYFYPFLVTIQDENNHTLTNIRMGISHIMKLSPEDLKEKTRGGRYKHNDRVKWAATYLKVVGLIISVDKGVYKITEKGINVLHQYGEKFSLDIIRDMKEYRQYSRRANPSNSHWVEGHYRYDDTYVPGYYSNFKAQGLRKINIIKKNNGDS